MLGILIIAAAFLWGFATAANTKQTTDDALTILTARPILMSIGIAFGIGFVLSGLHLIIGVIFAAISAFGSYTAARASDDNPAKKFFDLYRKG